MTATPHGTNAGTDDPLIWYDHPTGGRRLGLVAGHQGSVIAVTEVSERGPYCSGRAAPA